MDDESLRAGTITKRVPLIELCFGRSGDKGDAANIGVFVRDARYHALVERVLTADAVRSYMAHMVKVF